MVDNWKGFLAIIQKFVDSLKSSINLQYPVRCITSEINKNLNKLFHVNVLYLLFSIYVLLISFFRKTKLKKIL